MDSPLACSQKTIPGAMRCVLGAARLSECFKNTSRPSTMQYNRGNCSLGDQRCANKRTQKREGENIISDFVCFEHASVLETHELGGDGRQVPFPAHFSRRNADLRACTILSLTASARTQTAGLSGCCKNRSRTDTIQQRKFVTWRSALPPQRHAGKGTGPQSPPSSSNSNTRASYPCAWFMSLDN